MPRKSIVTKEQIIEAAFEISKEAGKTAITIRKIASYLDISTAPVYTQYAGVEGIFEDLRNYVNLKMESSKFTNRTDNPFLDIGVGILRFAYDYKRIFNDYFLTTELSLFEYHVSEQRYIEQMKLDPVLGVLSDDNLKEILHDMNVYTFGLATQICLDRTENRPFEFYQRKLEKAGKSLIGYYLYSTGKIETVFELLVKHINSTT